MSQIRELHSQMTLVYTSEHVSIEIMFTMECVQKC